MKSTAHIYVHPNGDTTRYVHAPTDDGRVLAGVSVGPTSIQSTDPDALEQLAYELLAAVAAQRGRAVEAVSA